MNQRQRDNENQLRFRRDRDFKIRLLEWYLIFVGSVIVGAVGFNWLAQKTLIKNVKAEDISLAQAIALETDLIIQDSSRTTDDLITWLAIIAADRSTLITILDARGRITIRQDMDNIGAPTDRDWLSWQADVVQNTRRQETGSFIETDPNGDKWLNSHVTTPVSGWRIILQRPFRVTFATGQGFNRGLFIAIGLYVIGGVFFWLLLSNQIITPLAQLEAFSSLIRWRGHVRTEEKTNLNTLSSRRDQIGGLARSLTAMAQDIDLRFIQLSTLLETSQIVASTLDTPQVIDNILDQVQRLFDVERCAVVALDKEAGVFRIQASRGLSPEYVNHLRIAPSEPNSPAMRALKNKEPIQVTDTETDLIYTSYLPQKKRAKIAGFRSVLVIPLQTQHAPPAVLSLYKNDPYRYSFSELELAKSFANHAAIAMENAALYSRSDAQLQEQTRRLKAIMESMEDGLILESLDGKILYCNPQLGRLLGIQETLAKLKTSGGLFRYLIEHAESQNENQNRLEEIISKPGSRMLDLVWKHPNGRFLDFRIHLFDVTDAKGELMGRGHLWQDITSDKELDRMKSTLISTVSHELRTPLAAIKGYVSTLLAEDVVWNADDQRAFLQTINDETNRLTKLVKDLLDMSRIEAGNLPMYFDFHALTDLIPRVTDQMMANGNAHGRDRIHLNIPPDLPPVWVDAQRIETVMRNLLENASKYSPPDQPIEINALRRNDEIIIQVRDFGSGIPNALQTKIFERFYRADSSLSRKVGGVGLGLSICKGFVEAHGGKIWVKNQHPGAAFNFSLPTKEQT